MHKASRIRPPAFESSFRRVHLVARRIAAAELRRESPALRRMIRRGLVDATPSEYPYLFLVSFGAMNRRSTALAACVHLFQTSTFVLDDILDDAIRRNNGPSVAAQFGIPSALIVGQLLQAIAMEQFLVLSRPATRRARSATAAFLSLARSVYCGQFRDVSSIGRVRSSFSDYRRMIDLTTGSFLGDVAYSGAVLGGRDEHEATKYRRFARAYGMALQASDDILDVIGSPRETGKQRGMDLRTRRPRLPFLVAMRFGSPRERRNLGGFLMNTSRSHARFAAALKCLRSSSVLDGSVREMSSWLVRAVRIAESVADVRSRSCLLRLVEALPADQGIGRPAPMSAQGLRA